MMRGTWHQQSVVVDSRPLGNRGKGGIFLKATPVHFVIAVNVF